MFVCGRAFSVIFDVPVYGPIPSIPLSPSNTLYEGTDDTRDAIYGEQDTVVSLGVAPTISNFQLIDFLCESRLDVKVCTPQIES
jgi:hypothetical protein